ncbi:hypothetical protein D3C72_2358580 [compost metagenome]
MMPDSCRLFHNIRMFFIAVRYAFREEGQEDRTITKLGGYERNERTIYQAIWIYRAEQRRRN